MLQEKTCRYAFMLSNWYSGATLFAILLNNHSKITCNGETFPFKGEDRDIYLCTCGKRLLDCEFFRETASHMMDEGSGDWNKDIFVVLPGLSKITLVDRWLKSFRYLHRFRDWMIDHIQGYHKKVDIFLSAHMEFYKKSCDNQGTELYIDGTKSIRRAELFAKHYSDKFKIIHLIRDGRGYCYSYLKNRNLTDAYLPKAMNEYMEYIGMIDIFTKRYNNIHVMTLRYEDLCRELNGSLSKICDFLTLPFEKSMSHITNNDYHILGNVMRKSFDGNIRESLTWKEAFSASKIEKMNVYMKENLERFGYF